MVDRAGPILISAGPTYEPIDAVRFIGNRSSGRLGVALAQASVRHGFETTLLLGPNCVEPAQRDDADDTRLTVRRFRTTTDLESLLEKYWPEHATTLIMAAAVADFRPIASSKDTAGSKLERSAGVFDLRLEPTPDLLAACSARRKPGQFIVGFALEPATRLYERASAKLARKNVDAIVANPLETMDAIEIDATVMWADGSLDQPCKQSKTEFANWLIDAIKQRVESPKRDH